MKKAKKKGTPSAKTLRGRRSAPSKKPFRLEVGKTYENRRGTLVVHITGPGRDGFPDQAFAGSIASSVIPWNGYGPFWHEDGLYHRKDMADRESWRDLVREVPPQKSPKGRGK